MWRGEGGGGEGGVGGVDLGRRSNGRVGVARKREAPMYTVPTPHVSFFGGTITATRGAAVIQLLPHTRIIIL